MNEVDIKAPHAYGRILERTQNAGFTMASDVLTCSLLRTLAASKASGKLLELGTGTGLATSWLLDGMDSTSILTSVDNDPNFLKIAVEELSPDKRLTLQCTDGNEWIQENKSGQYDLIFADTWPGKYFLLDDTLKMLTTGGIYVIDDMLPQPNWPEGHAEKAERLEEYLNTRQDLLITKLVWASGIIIATKR